MYAVCGSAPRAHKMPYFGSERERESKGTIIVLARDVKLILQ